MDGLRPYVDVDVDDLRYDRGTLTHGKKFTEIQALCRLRT
jgi:hypothetical protein